MDGVQARRIFDLLVATGCSPQLSAEKNDDGDTVFSVTLDDEDQASKQPDPEGVGVEGGS